MPLREVVHQALDAAGFSGAMTAMVDGSPCSTSIVRFNMVNPPAANREMRVLHR